ncbi:MAG TPA: metallophosphoesterase [Planctomycetota bacterium]|nr:metallophosphoesterase [Planctomycetota bacterium]
MKLGVMSDSHDNLPMIRKAVHCFSTEEPVDAVVHAGDFVAPFAVSELAKLSVPIYGVFGNNDGEHAGINKVLPQIDQPPLHLELGGRTLVVTHDIASVSDSDRAAADIVIFGHTHNKLIEHREGKLLLNPGELGGWLTGKCTVAIIDLNTLDVELLYLWEG